MLYVIMLIVIMLNVIMFNVLILSVGIQSVVMLNVVAPLEQHFYCFFSIDNEMIIILSDYQVAPRLHCPQEGSKGALTVTP
jgi:hypothetical protein